MRPTHSIMLSLRLIEPLNPAPALFGAKLMELWSVTCSTIVVLYYNSPNNRRYLTVYHEPILRLQPTHSILLSLLLMEPMIPSPALLGAKLMELRPFTCSTIVHYYNSPNNRRYLTVSHEPRLRPPQPAHSILLSLLLMEPLNPALASFGTQLMELWPFTCSIIVHCSSFVWG
jgi:hypothetical protein